MDHPETFPTSLYMKSVLHVHDAKKELDVPWIILHYAAVDCKQRKTWFKTIICFSGQVVHRLPLEKYVEPPKIMEAPANAQTKQRLNLVILILINLYCIIQ